jgi:hypothetical protein
VAPAALLVALIALVAALGGAAYALPGKKSVDKNDLAKNVVKTKNIKNGAVTGAKLAPGLLGGDTLPKAYLHFNEDGTYIPGQSRGIVSINQPVPNVACLDLNAPAKTGGATRGLAAGATPITPPQIGIPPEPSTLGCPDSHSDAVVQLAADSEIQDVYAWFDF